MDGGHSKTTYRATEINKRFGKLLFAKNFSAAFRRLSTKIPGYRIDLSRLINTKPKTIIISLITGSLAITAYILVRKVLDNRPPKKWKKVGEITDLLCYPLKSGSAVRADNFDCSVVGLQVGNLRDRTFMVVDMNGEFVSGRVHPQLVLVRPRIVGDQLQLSAPGMINLEVDIQRLQTAEPFKAIIWGQLVDAVDAGEEAARWFSRFLLQDDFGLRLLYYPSPVPTRKVKKKSFFGVDFSLDAGAFHDAVSFLMINEGSIGELNSRVEVPTSALQFRPNLVVKGPFAFEEDNWKWVKIGDETIFRNVKPCKRCLFVNVDPQTGSRSPNHEPLRTLKSYRRLEKCGENPVMGIYLGLRKEGKVRLGDSVFVEC